MKRTLKTSDLSFPLLVFFSILLLYLWSMPQTVVLEDDGLFLLTAYFNGVAHPPGYPLYTLLSHAATWVPLGSVASRVHGFTAVLGALCCVCLYQVIRQLLSERYTALVASLAFGFSLAFWSQSIIAEVYNLNVLIILLLLRLSLAYVESTDTRRQQYLLNWMGLLYGLGLSNHWPLLVLSTPLFLFVLLPCWREILRQFPQGTLFGLLALTPYLWMVWRTQMDPLISFYGPINDWQEFWSFISRKIFAGVEQSSTAGWDDKLAFSGYALVETSRQFTWAGMVLVIVGFVSQWKHWRWPVAAGLTSGYAGNTFVLIGMLGLDYDYLNQVNFRPCPLVAYAVCGIWLALGLKLVVEWTGRRCRDMVRLELLRGGIGALVISLPLLANTGDNYRATDTWAEDYAKVILDSLEPDAVLFTYGDTDVWTIGYINLVLKYRPDVTVYNTKGTVFSNRLFEPGPILWEDVQNKFIRFINLSDRPVYYTNYFPESYGETDYGLFARVDKNSAPGQQQLMILPGTRQYIVSLLQRGEPVDAWEKMHYRLLLAKNCLQSVRLRFSSLAGVFRNDVQHNEWVGRVCDNFQGKMLELGYLLETGANRQELVLLLEQTEKLKDQAIMYSELMQLEEYKRRLNKQ